MKQKNYTWIFTIFIVAALTFIIKPTASACDGSGYVINDLIANPDGTFTIDMTIHVAGFDWQGGILGGTHGFYFTVDAPILSVFPPSITSQNGTTLTAVIAGNTVTWGDPVSGPYFVASTEPTQTFDVTLIVSSLPTEWNGGGMEENGCPGGAGTSNPSPGYSGVFPCIVPSVIPVLPIVNTCAGVPVNLSVITAVADQVIWNPGNLMGNNVTVTPFTTTTYTVTAINGCAEASAEITVIVDPQPDITVIQGNQSTCSGTPAILQATTINGDLISWEPTGSIGPTLIDFPTETTTYTVTASNQCGEISENITVTVTPWPEATVLTEDQNICQGESVTLDAEVQNADITTWEPTGATDPVITVNPEETTVYTFSASSSCGLVVDSVMITVFQDEEEELTFEACPNGTVEFDGESLLPGTTTIFDYQTYAGCDSTVTVIVNELSESTSEVEFEVCEGETINYEGQELSPGTVNEYTFSAFNGCDSTVTVSVFGLQPSFENLELETCIGTTVFFEGEELQIGSVTEFTFVNYQGCDSTVEVSVNGLANYNYDVELEACEGTNANYNGQELSPGTVTEFMFSTYQGCDSLITVSVIELNTSFEQLEFEVCEGTTYNYNGQNLQPNTVTEFTFSNAVGCDSLVEVSVLEVNEVNSSLELETCEGTTISYEGVELSVGETSEFTYTAANGCDSVLTVNVTGLELSTSSLELETCEGIPIMYNGESLNGGTTTDFVFISAIGCDSTVTVSVIESEILTSSLELETCEGSTVNYNGQDLDSGSVTDFNLTAQNGCDSVVTVSVIGLPFIQNQIELQTCEGTTANYNGENLTVGTNQDFHFVASNGCDSVVNVSVIGLPFAENQIQLETCEGTTVSYNGEDLPVGANQEFYFIAFNGCDSIVTVSVLGLNDVQGFVELETCDGTTANYNGQDLTVGSQTQFTFIAQNGCDSVVTVEVNGLPPSNSTLTLQTCEGTTTNYNGQNLAIGSTTDFTFSSFNGCDSTVAVSVIGLEILTSSLELFACEGTSVEYNGQNLTAGTEAEFIFNSQSGCDSVVTVKVTGLNDSYEQIELQTCDGSMVNYNGQNLAVGSPTEFNFTSVNGCDSTVNVLVTGLSVFSSDLELETCEGTSAFFNGQDLAIGTTTDFSFAAQNGCDSVVTVSVIGLPDFDSNLEIQTCEGSTVFYDGQELAVGTQTPFHFNAQNGCDSTVLVSVIGLPNISSDLDLETCEGTTVIYEGETLSIGSSTDFIFPSFNGCDSIVTVTVSGLDIFSSALEFQNCEGEPVFYEGFELDPGTTTPFIFPAENGCDSTVFVTVLDPLPSQFTQETFEICDGESVLVFGNSVNQSGIYEQTFSSFYNCDSVHTIEVLVSEAINLEMFTEKSCPNENSGIAEISATGGYPPFNFLWDNGQTHSALTDLASGVYSVTVTDSHNCTTETNLEIGQFDIEFEVFSEILCHGETGYLEIEIAEPNARFSMDGTHFYDDLIFDNISPGQHEVFVQDEHSCIYSETEIVTDPPEVFVSLPEDLTIELGESVRLSPQTSVGNLSFNWNSDTTLNCTNCESPMATPFFTTNYTVEVKNENDCAAYDDITIYVKKSRNIYIPNAFSPNGDGTNDVFLIYGDGRSITKIHSLSIFTRWGERVFESRDFLPNDPAFGWDGTHRAELLNGAGFVYFADVEFIDGKREIFKGDVTLVR